MDIKTLNNLLLIEEACIEYSKILSFFVHPDPIEIKYNWRFLTGNRANPRDISSKLDTSKRSSEWNVMEI